MSIPDENFNENYWEQKQEGAISFLKICGYNFTGMDGHGNYLFIKDKELHRIEPETLIAIGDGDLSMEDLELEDEPALTFDPPKPDVLEFKERPYLTAEESAALQRGVIKQARTRQVDAKFLKGLRWGLALGIILWALIAWAIINWN
jgi:hypothetical protein